MPQDPVGDILFIRVIATLESIHRHGITANALGFEGMADRGALVK